MGSIMVLVIVFVLDLIAFSLAIVAKLRTTHAKLIEDEDGPLYCKYNKDEVKILGVGAFLFLLASQLLIMFASRCLCCGRGLRPGFARSCAAGLFISCWVAFFIAEVCLLAGSVEKAYHIKYTANFKNPPSCQALRKGVFVAGAAFVVITGIISEIFYVNYSKCSSYTNPTYHEDKGVRMNHLQPSR